MLTIASRTEHPKPSRRKLRAPLKIAYRNPDQSRWVKFHRSPEDAYQRYLMLTEANERDRKAGLLA